jgi:hypothetical protein
MAVMQKRAARVQSDDPRPSAFRRHESYVEGRFAEVGDEREGRGLVFRRD